MSFFQMQNFFSRRYHELFKVRVVPVNVVELVPVVQPDVPVITRDIGT